jgi:hypothetical protein
LCGPQTDRSVLAHASGHLLEFISTYDACALRATCFEAKDACDHFPFEDVGYWSDVDKQWYPGTPIVTLEALATWRRCFPKARGANLSGSAFLRDEHIERFLKGAKSLDISACEHLTDACFVHLRGIKKLVMSECIQFSDAIFPHLKNIHTLIMGNCYQTSITSAAFEHLKGIHTLVMYNCDQHTITDKAFEYLQEGMVSLQKPLHTVLIGNMDQATLTSATLYHLKGVKRLLMWSCTQFTDSHAFAVLKAGGLESLDASGCTQLGEEHLKHMGGLRELSLRGCTQLDEAALAHLKGVGKVDLSGCRAKVLNVAKRLGLQLAL